MSDQPDQPTPEEPQPDISGAMMPPGLQAAIIAHQMQMEAVAHSITDFFQTLNEEQLATVRLMFNAARGDESTSAYYVALATSALHHRFGICMGCSRKHDDEIAKFVGDGSALKDESALDPNRPADSPPPPDDTVIEVDGVSRSYVEWMEVYGVEKDDDGSSRVMCINCKTWYNNLADRMLKPPGKDGCSNCIQKEKWG